MMTALNLLSLLCAGAVIVWRCIEVVDYARETTCWRVCWGWIALGGTAIVLVFSSLAGDEWQAAARAAFVVAVAWVLYTDRRVMPRRQQLPKRRRAP